MNNRLRLPDYLKRPIAHLDNIENKHTKVILSKYSLNTVCDGARCPNKCECYSKMSATFLIMGKNCTRNCKFCNISNDAPSVLDDMEPKNVAHACRDLKLKYVVITSVTRDDVDDYGAGHYANTINKVRKINPDIKIEILTPDFQSNYNAIDKVLSTKPDVFNHNIETVKRLYPDVRDVASYNDSLCILKYAKEKYNLITKTGIMVGLGESTEEIEELFCDVVKNNIDILTIGQYISPSKRHRSVTKYYTVQEFDELKEMAKNKGVKVVVSSPLARSSYRAQEAFEEALSI